MNQEQQTIFDQLSSREKAQCQVLLVRLVMNPQVRIVFVDEVPQYTLLSVPLDEPMVVFYYQDLSDKQDGFYDYNWFYTTIAVRELAKSVLTSQRQGEQLPKLPSVAIPSSQMLFSSPVCTPHSVARPGMLRPLNEWNVDERMSILQGRLADIQARNASPGRSGGSLPCTVQRATPPKSTSERVDDLFHACTDVMSALHRFSSETMAEACRTHAFSMDVAEALLEDALATLQANRPPTTAKDVG